MFFVGSRTLWIRTLALGFGVLPATREGGRWGALRRDLRQIGVDRIGPFVLGEVCLEALLVGAVIELLGGGVPLLTQCEIEARTGGCPRTRRNHQRSAASSARFGRARTAPAGPHTPGGCAGRGCSQCARRARRHQSAPHSSGLRQPPW